jgi:AcrR family transcriptional regulator
VEAARNDRLVLDAARYVFAAEGYGAPVSRVAERAGVGVGSLYRRYGSKLDLLRRLCVLAMDQAIETAEAALASEDPWRGFDGYVRASVAFGAGAFAVLAGTIEPTAEMIATSRRGLSLLDQIVARTRDAGVLRPDVTSLDVAWLIEMFSRRYPAGVTAEDINIRDRLLAIALDGQRTPDPSPLPGTPPSMAHYTVRWRVPEDAPREDRRSQPPRPPAKLGRNPAPGEGPGPPGRLS